MSLPSQAVLRRTGSAAEALRRFFTWRRLSRWPAVALAAWSLVYAWSILTGSPPLDRFGRLIGADYSGFYAAGRVVAAGPGHQLYDSVLLIADYASRRDRGTRERTISQVLLAYAGIYAFFRPVGAVELAVPIVLAVHVAAMMLQLTRGSPWDWLG